MAKRKKLTAKTADRHALYEAAVQCVEADIDFVECESEVDALLVESRLIKDIQPVNNKIQKDDKTFPYLMITTREDFPRVEVTREPRDRGVKLYGPFASAGALRGAIGPHALKMLLQNDFC